MLFTGETPFLRSQICNVRSCVEATIFSSTRFHFTCIAPASQSRNEVTGYCGVLISQQWTYPSSAQVASCSGLNGPQLTSVMARVCPFSTKSIAFLEGRWRFQTSAFKFDCRVSLVAERGRYG